MALGLRPTAILYRGYLLGLYNERRAGKTLSLSLQLRRGTDEAGLLGEPRSTEEQILLSTFDSFD